MHHVIGGADVQFVTPNIKRAVIFMERELFWKPKDAGTLPELSDILGRMKMSTDRSRKDNLQGIPFLRASLSCLSYLRPTGRMRPTTALNECGPTQIRKFS